MADIKSFLFWIFIVILMSIASTSLMLSILVHNLPENAEYITEQGEKRWDRIFGAATMENVSFDKIKEYCLIAKESGKENMQNESNKSLTGTLPFNLTNKTFSIDFEIPNDPKKFANSIPAGEVIDFIDSMSVQMEEFEGSKTVAVYIPKEACQGVLDGNVTTIWELREEVKKETQNKIEKISSYGWIFFTGCVALSIIAYLVLYFDSRSFGHAARDISKYWLFTAAPVAVMGLLLLSYGPKLIESIGWIPGLGGVASLYNIIGIVLEQIVIIYMIITIFSIFGWLTGFGISKKRS